MLGVMLIDDEREILLGLERIIDWNSLGFEIVLSTTDPREALAGVSALRPAVVMTDIKMPQMSGLDLIAQIHDISPETRAVILSGYDDFLMAKRALRYGVVNYLLKPTDEDELTATLRQIRRLHETGGIKQARETGEASGDARVKERMFLRLFDGTAAYLQGADLQAFFELNHNITFSLALIKPAQAANNGDPFSETLLPILSAYREYYYKEYGGFFAVVIVGPVDQSDYFGRCGRSNADAGKARFYTALSPPMSDLSLISNRMARMRVALDRAIFFGEADRGVYCKEHQETDGALSPWDAKKKLETMGLIKSAVTTLQFERAERVMLEVRDGLRRMSRRMEPREACNLYRELLNHLKALMLYNFGIPGERLEPIETLLARLDGMQGIDELARESVGAIRAMVKGILTSFRSSRHHINLIEYYIKLHLAEELTLKRVAAAFYFNSSYLSTLFAKETGQTFSAYVTNLRLDCAAQLLGSTPAVIDEIAVSVGFSSDKTFYKQFKRRFRCTPGEYRAKRNPAPP